MPLRIAFLVAVCALATVQAGSSAHESSDDSALDEFEVQFRTNKPLGMQLDSDMRVTGFRRMEREPDGRGPAEASGWLRPGDVLLSVNEAAVTGQTLQGVGALIHRASLPKILRFKAPRGENRAGLMLKLKSRPGGMDGIRGRVAFSQGGIEQLQVPFTLAEFGGRTGCWEAPIAWADPPEACGAPKNPSSLMNAIVVAMRGTCSFSAKAANVEEYAARGLIIVNTEQSPMVMPLDPAYGSDAALPVVSVGRRDGDRLARAAGGFTPVWKSFLSDLDSHGLSPGAGSQGSDRLSVGSQVLPSSVRLLTDGQFCGSALPPANSSVVDPASSSSSSSSSAERPSPEALHGMPAGTISLVGGEAVLAEYRLSEASAGVPVTSLRVVSADPPSACVTALRNAEEARGAAVLVDRGLCGFGVKIAALHQAGAALLIAVNTEPGIQAIATTAHTDAQAILQQQQDQDEHSSPPQSGSARADSQPHATLPAVTVTHSAGQRLRAIAADTAQGGEDAASLVSLRGRPDLAELWTELMEMLEHTRWPRAERSRRKLFYKLSKRHHPDKPGGSVDRFELLAYAMRRAGHRWQPEGSTFVDDYAG